MSHRANRLSADTSPEAEELLLRELAKRSPAEKLKMVSEINIAVRQLALTGLRARYPDDTENQIRIRLAEQLYGADFARALAERQSKK